MKKRLAVVMACGLVGAGLGGAARPAAAQWGRPSSAPGRPAGFGVSPYTNPYLNPYSNPYLYYAPQGGLGAAMVFMAAHQAQADAARARSEEAGARHAPAAGTGTGRGAMVPGGGAARYFGNGVGPTEPPGADGTRGGYYRSHDRYFRPNGY